MKSLRNTALMWMTVLLTGVGALAVMISYQLAQNEAAGFLDSQLRQIALNAGQGLAADAAPPADHDPEDEFAIQIWDAAGKKIRSSSSGIEIPLQEGPGFATISAGGEEWRVYTLGDSRRTVQVAQRMVVRQELAESAAIAAAAPILIVIPLTWLVIGWSLGGVMGRLAQLAQAIADRGADSKESLSVEGVPREVRPLVDAMNVLIGRLQIALDQQRRFVSDAAHELRTPLTALQLQIENLQNEASVGQSEQVASELSTGIRRTSVLLEQLLRMARFEAPVGLEHWARISLSDLITECMADQIAIASSKEIDLGFVARDPAEVAGAPGELKIFFGNLLNNAVRYTPCGGTIDVSVRFADGNAVVEFVDSGCGVAESDLPRLFDRFFRAAPAEIDGSGLGLAIVEAIARRHGWVVTVENRTDRSGLIARVTAPGFLIPS